MLREHSNKVNVLFVATFTPQIGYATKLSAAAEEIRRTFDNSLWQSTESSYTFRDPPRRLLCTAQWNQMFFQTLGWKAWEENVQDCSGVADIVLSRLGIVTLDRVFLKIAAFLDIGMEHHELVEQMFGTFLVEKDRLRPLSDDFFDNGAHLYGRRAGHRFRLQLLPQTAEQVKTTFFSFPNLDFFVENRLIDQQVREAWLAVGGKPSLFVDLEVYDEKFQADRTSRFMGDSLRIADELTRDAVSLLEDRPVQKRS